MQKVLAAHGAAKVSAYVTHGVFPKCSWERFLHKDGKYLHGIVHMYLLFEISVINVALCCDFQEAWRRHLPTFGSQIPALLLSKP